MEGTWYINSCDHDVVLFPTACPTLGVHDSCPLLAKLVVSVSVVNPSALTHNQNFYHHFYPYIAHIRLCIRLSTLSILQVTRNLVRVWEQGYHFANTISYDWKSLLSLDNCIPVLKIITGQQTLLGLQDSVASKPWKLLANEMLMHHAHLEVNEISIFHSLTLTLLPLLVLLLFILYYCCIFKFLGFSLTYTEKSSVRLSFTDLVGHRGCLVHEWERLPCRKHAGETPAELEHLQ